MPNPPRPQKIKNSVPGFFRRKRKLRDVEHDHRHAVTLLLRPGATARDLPDTDLLFVPGRKRGKVDRKAFFKNQAASPADIEAVRSFARDHDLEIVRIDPEGRRVELLATHATLQALFGVRLLYFKHQGREVIGHRDAISIPAALKDIVEGVLGFNTLPFRRHTAARDLPPDPLKMVAPGIVVNASGEEIFAQAGATGFSGNRWAGFYNFPEGLDGSGQCIAIISMGGGYQDEVMTSFFKDIKVRKPKIIGVGAGATNSPGVDPMADGEVATDVQTAGAAAPGARIVVYFAPNSPDGLHSALTAALTDTANKPSVISISYGSAEGDQGNSPAEMDAINKLFLQAAHLNVTVLVSSGDLGSTLGTDQPQKLRVEFPASSPYVLTVGGTSATISTDFKHITAETAWNQVWHFMGGTSQLATGGGFSTHFPRPAYQQQAIANTYPAGFRGLPDVAASANPSVYGYFVRTSADTIVGGTSAATPLWAALIACINQRMGERGFLNADLYELPGNHPAAFNLIRTGNNSLISSIPEWQANPDGWDPCTGLGVPNGTELLKGLSGLEKHDPQAF